MTATPAIQPTSVHLVGSIGLDSVAEVFRTTGKLLGRRLKRVPDGEPGPRRLWASFQYPLLRSSPYLRPDPGGALRKTSGFPLLSLAEGVSSDEVSFGELGYAREARASYLDFCAARDRGELPADARFQVCLPTPMGVIYAFCIPKDVLAVEPAYERAMMAEVAALCAGIPHKDLSIQWDFCHEMIIWDGQPQDMFPLVGASKPEILARLGRICADIPAGVELGFHLCYGDFGARHFVEPRDATAMVEVCNGIADTILRPVGFIHIPVPINRDDEAFFQPLTALRLPKGCDFYLGLVHARDGVEGTHRRIAVARKFVPSFGVATECGIARARKPSLIVETLQVYADASREPV
ncbi:hypothetical protein PY365_32115 [Roseiarcaceae bacterium H3SJ34-1]|uniref:hypothetical protein n=1 Tax=Terripilifer ovatus TaxID=3032367 RepID=UPI003AB94C00|nr:hypothetical protein [Roseiarcaceae bacterium H3SJ34-1]